MQRICLSGVAIIAYLKPQMVPAERQRGGMENIQMMTKGETNIKWLSKVLIHQEPPQQIQCSVTYVIQVSELYWWDEHHSLQRHSLIWCKNFTELSS